MAAIDDALNSSGAIYRKVKTDAAEVENQSLDLMGLANRAAAIRATANPIRGAWGSLRMARFVPPGSIGPNSSGGDSSGGNRGSLDIFEGGG